MFFYDPTIIILIPALLIAMYAQYKVKNTFKKYSEVLSNSNKTAAEIAQDLLFKNDINDINVKKIKGNLNDHYDPKNKVLNLSEGIYGSKSVAAIGIAAHEAGHAIQDARGYTPLKIRAKIVPAASIGSSWGLPLAIVGFFLQSQTMIALGFIMFLGALIFHLITLPVEFDASNKALTLLKRNNILNNDELKGAKKVLRAAAFTYVSATLIAIVNLVRIVLLFGMGRND
ncbi:MAG: zinc metallopeptidase [Cyclobacterium sp.]|uniref:zinc metallopeptidase n=1 Tax=Cyclobacterium sp. TaxID=1966343 RepID=UPI0039705378